MKKHLIENYEIKNLNSNSKSIAVDLRAKLISALEGSISELDYLKSSLQNYKHVLDSFTDLNLENADILSKYRYDSTSNSFNLPGVFASSVGSYDIDSIKADNLRLSELKAEIDKIETEQSTYYRMIIGNTNDLLNKIGQIKKYNVLLTTFLNQLESSLDE